jgi:hypothetical protein
MCSYGKWIVLCELCTCAVRASPHARRRRSWWRVVLPCGSMVTRKVRDRQPESGFPVAAVSAQAAYRQGLTDLYASPVFGRSVLFCWRNQGLASARQGSLSTTTVEAQQKARQASLSTPWVKARQSTAAVSQHAKGQSTATHGKGSWARVSYRARQGSRRAVPCRATSIVCTRIRVDFSVACAPGARRSLDAAKALLLSWCPASLRRAPLVCQGAWLCCAPWSMVASRTLNSSLSCQFSTRSTNGTSYPQAGFTARTAQRQPSLEALANEVPSCKRPSPVCSLALNHRAGRLPQSLRRCGYQQRQAACRGPCAGRSSRR